MQFDKNSVNIESNWNIEVVMQINKMENGQKGANESTL